jgi:poly(3-hydroxybutyrate) depolymerase
LLTIEGERDDICALGQTLAAQDLYEMLPQYLRTNYVQAGVGYYGVFSGKHRENLVHPAAREVTPQTERRSCADRAYCAVQPPSMD